jgi:hypothetical protein
VPPEARELVVVIAEAIDPKWDPNGLGARLERPDGTPAVEVGRNSTLGEERVVREGNAYVVRIQNPAAGEWTLALSRADGGPAFRGAASASVDAPKVGLTVTAREAGALEEIIVAMRYDTPLALPARLSVRVDTAVGTRIVEDAHPTAADPTVFVAYFKRAHFTRGTHRITAFGRTNPATTQNNPGESLFARDASGHARRANTIEVPVLELSQQIYLAVP